MSIPELSTLALAARMKVSPTEIDEGWSQRDVNLMLFFFEAQAMASNPKI